jgi:ABC-type transporter Mla maintaining outer membrane lipid asymmetry ATPase subunit MlaF
MTLYANIALPLIYHTGMGEEALRPRVMPMLEAVGLAPLQHRFPAQLTQGEARCAALARALIMDQELLLLDELTAGLDADMLQHVERVLAEYRGAHAVTIVATMHAASPFLETVDRIAFVRNGRIEAVGRYADMARTSDATMRAYLGHRPVS